MSNTNGSDGGADPFDLAKGLVGVDGSLRPKPKFSDRISKRVLIIFMLLCGAAFVLFMLSIDNLDSKQAVKDEQLRESASAAVTASGKAAGVPAELTGKAAGSTELVAPSLTATTKVSDANKLSAEPAPGSQGKAGEAKVPPVDGPTRDELRGNNAVTLSPAQQAAESEHLARLARLARTRSDGLSVRAFAADGTASAPAGSPLDGALTAGAENGIMSQLLAAAKSAQGQATSPPAADHHEEMVNFLAKAKKEPTDYHGFSSVEPVSKNELKAGSSIPMALQQTVNSDLPGMVTAMVTESVYDTVTGCRLLIPVGSKVLGRYDSKVALGQGRLLVAWNLIMFPNGDELALGGVEGYDTSGQAGLNSEVNNHYLRTFGLTLGLSIVGAATQVSVPQPNPGVGGAAAQQTPAQLIATALAQQYGQLGASILTKQLAIQPTLKNYVGERFIIVLPSTIILKKVWRSRCSN